MLYVVLRRGKRNSEIFGNRKGEPFTDKVNAQRSLAKRVLAHEQKSKDPSAWTIMEINK